MDSNYQQIEQDYQKLIEELSDSGVVSDLERFDYLSKRKSQLELIMKNKIAVEEIERQINENESIISAKEDNELLSLVSEEQTLLRERKRKLRTGWKICLKN